MFRLSIKALSAAVLVCFTVLTTADASACHHRRRCGGGGCGGYSGCGGGGCGYDGGCGYSAGCGGGYCYTGYGYGGYYTAMPAPLFPRLAFANRGRVVAPPVYMARVAPPSAPFIVSGRPIVAAASVPVRPAPAAVISPSADAGTPNALAFDAGGNQ